MELLHMLASLASTAEIFGAKKALHAFVCHWSWLWLGSGILNFDAIHAIVNLLLLMQGFLYPISGGYCSDILDPLL
jgi:hypothetical protein